MLVPIIIAVACFAAGVIPASRWLPDLAEGPFGTIAFFVVCGLCGAVLAIVGIYVYLIVRDFERTAFETMTITADLLAAMLRDAGTVSGLALTAYLLAPKRPHETFSPAAEVSYAEHP